MRIALVFLACFGLAMCAVHHTLDEVIAMVIRDTDVDLDGCISEAEFRNELLAKWDSSVPPDDQVSKNDFVHQWTTTYGDNHNDASTFFNNMDSFLPFGVLTEVDLLFHLGTLDPDGDGCVSTADFRTFVLKLETEHEAKQGISFRMA